MIKRLFFIIGLIIFSNLTGISYASSTSSPTDSIGVERRNNRIYILHQVEKKESVNTIAKRYRVNVAVIKMVNAIQNDVIKIGQVLRIPLIYNYADDVVMKDKRVYTVKEGDNLYRIARDVSMDINKLRTINNLKNDFISKGQKIIIEVAVGKTEVEQPKEYANAEGITQEDNRGDESYPAWVFEPAKLVRVPVLHTVAPKETLFKISSDSKIALDSIRIWNNLIEETIDVGDQLIVGYTAVTKPTEEDVLKKEEIENFNFPEKPKHLPEYRLEKGIGAIIPEGENDKPSTQKLALHATAGIGAYIKVRNPNNNRSDLVKVVGRLSEADVEKKIIIKINIAACKSIGLVNEKFPIEVTYNN